MNFVFVSPTFPKCYYKFCESLKNRGVNVLAIGDSPYDYLSQELINSVTEYYRVDSMENYDEMYRACAYFSFHYGKIDWLESNNEYWLEQDAKLRTDFNITTGIKSDDIEELKCKSNMKKYYERAGIKTARYHMVSTYEEGKKFIDEVGYPVVVKPDNGVGAAATYKLNNDEELKNFYNQTLITQYIMEEYVNGLIVTYDGIANLNKEVVFETSHVFPNPIMDVVNNASSMYYYSERVIPEDLQKAGKACVKEFFTAGRCFHMEFFRMLEDKKGLGKKGDLIGLEVNHRMPGAYTPDMMCWANEFNVYDAYADMVVEGQGHFDASHRPYHCIYCGRRDGINYQHNHEEIMNLYGDHMKQAERMPDILSGAMGNFTYTAIFETQDEVDAFVSYVLG